MGNGSLFCMEIKKDRREVYNIFIIVHHKKVLDKMFNNKQLWINDIYK